MNCKEHLGKKVLDNNLNLIYSKVDQIFFWLLLSQWLFAIILSLLISPYNSADKPHTLDTQVEIAILVGGLINVVPLILICIRPGWWLTRQSVAASQMLWSGLLIHLTGGRIETHFHIFASLAFLTFYRDCRLFPTATIIVTANQLIGALFWPESIYGIANPDGGRFLEHTAWLLFEDIVLILGCLRLKTEMKLVAEREAELECLNADIEQQVELRTSELRVTSNSLAQEMKTRLEIETELRQAQKLEAVGRLASGVAHEINTPIQFVSDSIYFLRDATVDLLTVIEKLQKVQQSVMVGTPSRIAVDEAIAAAAEADLPYLVESIPKAFDRSIDGLGRVASIVRSMKEFAHPDSKEMASVDLNRAIESTLTIARNEYKYVAEVEKDFGDLPPVLCYAGEINQAILNIIINAAHAIGDVVQGSCQKGQIYVRTRQEGENVTITISDTGAGIPEQIREKIFDPFFTTKEVGKGTGQGLSIARAVIIDKHKGHISLESEVGKGTTFFIQLPIHNVGVSVGN